MFKRENILLDNVAYVDLVDTMGDEFTPAEDARMSTNKGRLGDDKDAKLQERLMVDNHTSPFEGTVVKFELCVPLYVLRELERHRTLDILGEQELILPEENSRKWFSRNEMSGRYVKMPDQYYHPQTVRMQSKANKQGTSDNIVPVDNNIQQEFLTRGAELTVKARELYEWAVNNGIERGVARIYNTQNQYTKIRLTGNLKNWLNFMQLRCKPDVLWECRQYAENIRTILNALFPSVLQQWENNVLNAVVLSQEEAYVVYENFLDLSERCIIDKEILCKALEKIRIAARKAG